MELQLHHKDHPNLDYHLSYLLMKSMRWELNVMTLILVANVKFNVLCWSCSISWTVLTRGETSKLSWLPTELIHWIQPLFDQEELIGKLNSLCLTKRPSVESLIFTPVK